jgi:hypothetical protein
MAPEQLLGDRARIDGRADVYGLGATLYELLAARPLFDATDWPELVRAILDQGPQPLHEVNAAVSQELSRIVMKAIEKQPEDRYATAALMRDDLLAFADGRAVAGRPVSSARRRLRRLRRRWKPLAIAAAALLGAGLAYFNYYPATLSVRTYPVAQVLLDGESLGTTPLEASVRPGRRRLVLRSKGFKDVEREVKLAAGGTSSVDIAVLVADGSDPHAQEVLAGKYGFEPLTLAAVPSQTRGVERDDKVHPLYPAGKVRAEDLTDLRIDIGRDWDAKGNLEVRAGDKTVFSAPFDPKDSRTVLPVPDAAKAALKPGDEFEWGFYPEKGDPTVSKCKVVADSDAAKRIETDLAGQEPSQVAMLRAKQFLKEGLYLAAYREASRLAEAGKFGTEPLAVMQRAVAGMKLTDTPLEEEINEKVRAAGG